MPDALEPAELTEPVDVVAWLRALPVGTVLLARGDSHTPRAWQVRMWLEPTPPWEPKPREFAALLMCGSGEAYELADDDDMAMIAAEGPFQLLWTPGGNS